MPKPKKEFSEVAKKALNAFAKRNGHLWKLRLRHCWMTGDYRKYGADINEGAALQRIRNDPQFSLHMLRVYRPDLS